MRLIRAYPRQLYFIQQGGSGGPVKIGSTSNLKARLRGLQTANPIDLIVIGTTGFFQAGALLDIEAAALRQFSDSRIRGEWFHATPELLAFISRCKEFGASK